MRENRPSFQATPADAGFVPAETVPFLKRGATAFVAAILTGLVFAGLTLNGPRTVSGSVQLEPVSRPMAEAHLRNLLGMDTAGVLRDADRGKVSFSSFVLSGDEPATVAVSIGTYRAMVDLRPMRPVRVVVPVPAGGGSLVVTPDRAAHAVAHFRNGSADVDGGERFEVAR